MSHDNAWVALTDYWHCADCDWEGDDPGATYYKHGRDLYADEIFCPRCKDGGELIEGKRPEVAVVEDAE